MNEDSLQAAPPPLRRAVMAGKVGPVVRLARRAAGLTQRELGDLCGGYRQSSISRIEAGRTANPPPSMLRRIAEVTGIPPEWVGIASAPIPPGPAQAPQRRPAAEDLARDTTAALDALRRQRTPRHTTTGPVAADTPTVSPGWPEMPGGGLGAVPADTGLSLPWTAAGAIDATAQVVESGVMERRLFLSLGGSALAEPALDWLVALPAGDVERAGGRRRVLDAHVDGVEQTTEHLRRMDDRFGGGTVLDLVRSQVGHVLNLLRHHSYSASVGVRLHAAAAEVLRLAGFVSFDAGRHGQAQRYWLASLRAAHAAGDRSLGANVLAYMSLQAGDLGLYSEAVKLAEAARQGDSGRSPRVRAILNLRAAQAYARTGQARECRSAIDLAYDALRGQPPTSGEPAWSYWMDETVANSGFGYCYMFLEDWSRAQSHFQTSIRLQDDPTSRQAALTQTYLATTYARQGDPEHACETGGQAVDILAAEVESEYCVGHVRRLQAALSPYRRVAAVATFNERVSHQLDMPA